MNEYIFNPLILNKINNSEDKYILEIKENSENKIEDFLKKYVTFFTNPSEINILNCKVYAFCIAFISYKNKISIDRRYIMNLKYKKENLITVVDNKKFINFTIYDLIEFYYGKDEVINFIEWLKKI